MRKFIFLFFAWCMFTNLQAQVSSVQIMTWNLLNWPVTSSAVSDSTTRCPHYRLIMDQTRPDILVTQENAATYSTTWFLNCALNANGNEYSQGTYIHGFDTNNGIFYKDSLFDFVSNTRIPTALRDINEFVLVYKLTGDTIRIYSVHLKAGTGSVNRAARAAEVDALRIRTNSLPPGSDFIVCGDFNIYHTFEPAFQSLLETSPFNDGHVIDPLNLQDTLWNKFIYRQYHTQSTREFQGGGFVGGGLDDRFDMILISEAVSAPTGIYYVAGSTTPYGNDGNHYDKSINDGFNSAVPSHVADALYGASDHLPVIARFDIGPTSGIDEFDSDVSEMYVYPNPASSIVHFDFNVRMATELEIVITEINGKVVFSEYVKVHTPGRISRSLQLEERVESGLYFVSVRTNKSLINSKLIIYR